jgi:predicted DCC family thiol-disulfide oxidoreductase YuxK
MLPAMFSLRAMRVVCALAVFFHVGIHFSMEIFFFPNLLAYSAFVDWERVLKLAPVARPLQAWESFLKYVRGWMLPVIGLPLALLYTYVNNPVAAFLFLFGNGVWIRDSFIALVAAGIAAGYFLHLLRASLRRDRAVSSSRSPADRGSATPIILFDGVCGLCNGFIDWVLRHDKRSAFRFAPLLSNSGRVLLAQHGLAPNYIESIVLLDGTKTYYRSTAALQILRRLGLPWSIATVFIVLPPHLRDIPYDFIAERRYRWFGRTQQCRIPSASERARFITD